MQQVARGFGSSTPPIKKQSVASAVDAPAISNANVMLSVFNVVNLMLARQIRFERLSGSPPGLSGRTDVPNRSRRRPMLRLGTRPETPTSSAAFRTRTFLRYPAFINAQSAQFANQFAVLTAEREAAAREALLQNSLFNSRLVLLNATVDQLKNSTHAHPGAERGDGILNGFSAKWWTRSSN